MQPDSLMADVAVGSKVSVVVPSYNHELYIEECLRSIMSQSAPPNELIVIDDGSDDGSAKVIERVLKDCPFACEFYTRENRGLCTTLNEGLERAKGEYFAYLSSDDLWLSTFLDSRLRVLLAEQDAPLVYGHSFMVDEASRVTSYSYGRDLPRRDTTREMLLFSFVPTSSSILYRKSALETQLWDPEIKLEDFDLYLRLSAGHEFAYDPNVLSCWRTHPENTSKQVELMVAECIGAIERNAKARDLTDAELAAAVRSMNIYRVDTLLDDGERVEAIKMFFSNIQGFRDKKDLMKRAAKLLAPNVVIQKRRDLSKRYLQNKRAIGSIDSSFNFVPS